MFSLDALWMCQKHDRDVIKLCIEKAPQAYTNKTGMILNYMLVTPLECIYLGTDRSLKYMNGSGQENVPMQL